MCRMLMQCTRPQAYSATVPECRYQPDIFYSLAILRAHSAPNPRVCRQARDSYIFIWPHVRAVLRPQSWACLAVCGTHSVHTRAATLFRLCRSMFSRSVLSAHLPSVVQRKTRTLGAPSRVYVLAKRGILVLCVWCCVPCASGAMPSDGPLVIETSPMQMTRT